MSDESLPSLYERISIPAIESDGPRVPPGTILTASIETIDNDSSVGIPGFVPA